MSLSTQAESRKARLAQLKRVKRPEPEDHEDGDGVQDDTKKSVKTARISGRNFDQSVRAPKFGFDSVPTENEVTVELVSSALEQETLENLRSKMQSKDLDLASLQPKRVNWDLKRDLEPKIAVLEARTDNAILKMVKERLQESVKDLDEDQ